MSSKRWVCSNNSSHVCTEQEAEASGYFCNVCPFGVGLLVEEARETGGPVQEDLGLCIMLLDCSNSMTSSAFPDHPLSRKDVIAKGVAAGIFSLSGNPLQEFAYVLILGFDHEIVTILPYTSIQEIVSKFKDAQGLELYLKEKMARKNGATDINGALDVAFRFTQQFIDGQIQALGDYKARIQSVIDDKMISHLIPNIRVLLFTDGYQFLGDENDNRLLPSPFKNLQYNGRIFDLLMGAYYGGGAEDGFLQLKTLTSQCPRHPSIDQLFLFDSPAKVANLKGLFRMASGASGFCPKCLEEAGAFS